MRNHHVLAGVLVAVLPWAGPVVMALAAIDGGKWPVALLWPAFYLVMGIYAKALSLPPEARELRDGPIYRAFLQYSIFANFALGCLFIFELVGAGRFVPGIGDGLRRVGWTAAAVLCYVAFVGLSLVGQFFLRRGLRTLSAGKSRLWQSG